MRCCEMAQSAYAKISSDRPGCQDPDGKESDYNSNDRHTYQANPLISIDSALPLSMRHWLRLASRT